MHSKQQHKNTGAQARSAAQHARHGTRKKNTQHSDNRRATKRNKSRNLRRTTRVNARQRTQWKRRTKRRTRRRASTEKRPTTLGKPCKTHGVSRTDREKHTRSEETETDKGCEKDTCASTPAPMCTASANWIFYHSPCQHPAQASCGPQSRQTDAIF